MRLIRIGFIFKMIYCLKMSYIYVWYVCVHVILFQIKTNLCIFNTAEVRKIMFCVFFLLSTCKICTLLFVIVHYVETKTVDQVNDWQFCQLNVGLHVTYCTLPDFKYPNLLKYIMYNTNPKGLHKKRFKWNWLCVWYRYVYFHVSQICILWD